MAQQEKWQNKIGETYPQRVVETVSAWVIIAWNDKESALKISAPIDRWRIYECSRPGQVEVKYNSTKKYYSL